MKKLKILSFKHKRKSSKLIVTHVIICADNRHILLESNSCGYC